MVRQADRQAVRQADRQATLRGVVPGGGVSLQARKLCRNTCHSTEQHHAGLHPIGALLLRTREQIAHHNFYLQIPALAHLLLALGLQWVLQNLLLQDPFPRAGVEPNKHLDLRVTHHVRVRRSSLPSDSVQHFLTGLTCEIRW
ncbi:hypothetical protein EYF80_059270 [Liparis tanakae]|uniref:Uncharacterized protein n=1 Tax=Liparis tanakae TaxID=230148 RepID=A0A4Z2EPQ2_9TELE|nr:hypothetical protein EYF80_059270 [Liparis tanakae]